jgi:hypothetical protein
LANLLLPHDGHRLFVKVGRQGVRFDVGDEAEETGTLKSLAQSGDLISACHGALLVKDGTAYGRAPQ